MSKSKNYNLSSLNDLVEGNQEAVYNMILAFLNSTPSILKDMETCHKEGDYRRLADLSHKLKSSIDIFGIDALKDDIRELEHLCRNESDNGRINDLRAKVDSISKNVIDEFNNDFINQEGK